jgi:hypothetical protein
MLKLPKLDKRTAILWVMTGLVAGSIGASLSDMVRQNAWFIVYEGLVVGWLLVLTAITSIHVKERNTKD